MPRHPDENETRRPDEENKDRRLFYTDAGVSDGDASTGEFMSDMEYDEGDIFYEEIGGIIEGKDLEDMHSPDLTTDEENRRRR